MSDSTTDSERRADLAEDAFDLVLRLWSGQLLYASVELGLLDRLTDGPVGADAVARNLALDGDKTYRLLRALTYYDVVEETSRQQFSLTPVGECFLADHPHSIRADIRFLHSREFITAMFHLPDVVREGDSDGFRREFDRGLYEYAEEHSAFGTAVNEFMTARGQRYTDGILESLESTALAECSHVCDVGGGHGYLLARLLEAHPHLRGTVFDLPGVVADSDRLAAPKIGVADRCSYVAGDMFEAVPGADAYLLKEILHNWEDEDCVDILSTVHDAAPPDGRVFVIEAVVPGPEQDHLSKRLDMTMMVHLGGRERTEAEFETLLDDAGWEHVNTQEAPSGWVSVLEAVKT